MCSSLGRLDLDRAEWPSDSPIASLAKQPRQRVQRGVGVTCSAPHLRQGGMQPSALLGVRCWEETPAGRPASSRNAQIANAPSASVGHWAPGNPRQWRATSKTGDARFGGNGSRRKTRGGVSATGQARWGRSAQKAWKLPRESPYRVLMGTIRAGPPCFRPSGRGRGAQRQGAPAASKAAV